jgi:hypothetical protein
VYKRQTLRFSGNVIPESYHTSLYIVEGVGSEIKLINIVDFTTPENYAGAFETNFDEEGFDSVPFDSAENYALDPEYITINRGSQDRNPWSRYNRWVHEDVIATVVGLQGQVPEFDETKRAKRPIIEFQANIQLFNFGSISKQAVDFIDATVTDAFSYVEGSSGFYIDGVAVEDGQRVIFTAETDDTVRNRTYTINFVRVGGKTQIHLEAAADSYPNEGDSVIVKHGTINGGKTFHYTNSLWIHSQEKDAINQFPLFDLYDKQGNSYGDKSVYPLTGFIGSTLFQYKINCAGAVSYTHLRAHETG